MKSINGPSTKNISRHCAEDGVKNLNTSVHCEKPFVT